MDVRVLGRVPVERTLRWAATAAFARLLSAGASTSRSSTFSSSSARGSGTSSTLRHPDPGPLPLPDAPPDRLRPRLPRGVPVVAGRPSSPRVGPAARPSGGGPRSAWRRYRRIFPISGEVRRRILTGASPTPAGFATLHPGVELSAFVPSPPRDRTFFVPGRIMWTKNLELAIDAFRLFLATAPDRDGWQPRIAGIVDRKSEPYLATTPVAGGGEPSWSSRPPSDDGCARATPTVSRRFSRRSTRTGASS